MFGYPRLILITCLLLSKISILAQAENDVRLHSPELGFKSGLGYLMSHHTQMDYLVQGHVKTFEVYAEKIGNGRKDWHHAYRLPTVGLSLHFTDFGNPDEMGYAISAIPYMKLHFIKYKNFEFNTRLGSGLGFLTKYFERITNNKNSAIASPYNAAMSINFEPEYKSRLIDVGLGISFMHFSNGSWKTPNLGFNIPSLSFSFGYKFNNQVPELDKQKVMDTFEKKHHVEAGILGGAKEIMPANGVKYFVGGIHAQYRYRYSVKSNLLVFSDVNYNGGYKKAYENFNKITIAKTDAIRAGIGIGYGLSFDRLLIFLHNGFYVYDKLDFDGLFYHRLAAKYYFDNKLVATFSLRTHFAKADVVELGLGYLFR